MKNEHGVFSIQITKDHISTAKELVDGLLRNGDIIPPDAMVIICVALWRIRKVLYNNDEDFIEGITSVLHQMSSINKPKN